MCCPRAHPGPLPEGEGAKAEQATRELLLARKAAAAKNTTTQQPIKRFTPSTSLAFRLKAKTECSATTTKQAGLKTEGF